MQVGNQVNIAISNLSGKIMGFGTSNGQPIAIVYIDQPFWSENKDVYVTVLVVHMTNLELEYNDPS